MKRKRKPYSNSKSCQYHYEKKAPCDSFCMGHTYFPRGQLIPPLFWKFAKGNHIEQHVPLFIHFKSQRKDLFTQQLQSQSQQLEDSNGNSNCNNVLITPQTTTAINNPVYVQNINPSPVINSNPIISAQPQPQPTSCSNKEKLIPFNQLCAILNVPSVDYTNSPPYYAPNVVYSTPLYNIDL